MRLTSHTDYGLRLLMLGSQSDFEAISIPAVAAQLNVSRNHLMKVAQTLSKAGYLTPVRGRAGGFRLAKQPGDIRVGEAVRALEFELGLVECMRDKDSACPLLPGCRLPRLFGQALEAFFEVLDECTLDDLVTGNGRLYKLAGVR